MNLGKKVYYTGSRLWLCDEEGRACLGILRGEVDAIAKPLKGDCLEVSGYQPNVGHTRIRFEGTALKTLQALVPSLQKTIADTAPSSD